MENGQIYDGNIGVHEWKYYRYSLMDQDQSLQIILNETSLDTSIDCDLYVRLNKYPTTRRFTYSEVSVNQNSSIYIDAAATRGNYFIGVYGFQKCEFVIEAIQKGPCPNSCSGHGVCDVSSHTCNCDVGYGGDDCSLFNKTITNGEQVEGSIQAQQWNYYYFDNTVSGLINVTLISSTDPDIYVKKESLPTVFVWDYANATSFTTTSIIIPEATPGRYYIGVFGYATSTYTLTVNAAQMVCQSSCSNHGSCSGTVCQCQNNFSGLICENMTTSLENGQSVTGFVTSNVWNYYYFTSNTESNLIFTLHKLNVAGDADLFVERDSYPNITYYDYFNASSAPFTSVTVDQPGIRNWYIGVVGWSNTNYTIRVDIATTCNCVHGTCNADGVCVCELGWAGDSCDTVASLIQRNTLISGSVKNGEWLYYYFPATAHHISVVMKETSTAGMVWSYLHRDTFPTLRHHDAADRESETPYHLVSSSTKQVATKEYNYFVGFYGSPFIELNSTVSFSFEVWYF